jgi:hypothetical protein
MVPAEKAIVVTLESPNWSITALMSSTKLSAVGSPGMPSSLGSWAAATVSPTPTLTPMSVASEMLSTMLPSRSTRATSRITPTSSVNMARSPTGSVPSAATPAAIRVEPVRMATVEVVLTETVRDRPSRAYATHRHHAGVEADLHREVGDGGVRHRLGDDDGAGGQAADDVFRQPGDGLRPQPAERWDESLDADHGPRVERWRVRRP